MSRGEAGDYYRMGCLLHDLRKWGAAAGCFARVIEKEPENFRALANYGWNLHLSGRSQQGADALCEAARMAPEQGTTHALRSQVQACLGWDEAALENARLGVRHEPGPAINHVALAFCLMRLGHWAEGWREYEWRFQYKLPEFLNRPYRLWRGERVAHLYLEGEQGLGDSIFALRWLKEAANRADLVTLFVHGPVYASMSEMDLPGNVKAYPLPRPLPMADAWCPLMSLPAALEAGEASWPGQYVGRSARPAGWSGKLNIGVVWAGSPEHEEAHHRDCPLAYFLRLTEIPGITLHSLQVGPQSQQLSELAAYGLIIDRSPEITNLLDTAKILAELDLVVTVDTAVAHLAGAMGVPCWVLLNQRGQDFRWGRGDTTPWYPSLKLYRRTLTENWDSVMERVDLALRGLTQ